MTQDTLKYILSAALVIPVYIYLFSPSEPPPEHTIKYQTEGTLHLQATDKNMNKEQCLALIKYYRYQATHQIAVYKYSKLSNSIEPWCIINKKDPTNHEPFFNNLLFETTTSK